jgi:hypothetical protein
VDRAFQAVHGFALIEEVEDVCPESRISPTIWFMPAMCACDKSK